jgi:tRNA(fMet)-specific endonuclease VapC
MYLLDTNICVGLLRGDGKLAERIAEFTAQQLAVCSIVAAELFFSARKSQRLDHNLGAVSRFLEPFLSLPFDDHAARQYSMIRFDLERSGNRIGDHDMLIAAIAMANDCTLVTRSRREFERIAGLRLVSWG